MNIIKIGETNVSLTNESYAKYMAYTKAEKQVKDANNDFAKALDSYLYASDGCDKSDLYDYEKRVIKAENDAWTAWERFANRVA